MAVRIVSSLLLVALLLSSAAAATNRQQLQKRLMGLALTYDSGDNAEQLKLLLQSPEASAALVVDSPDAFERLCQGGGVVLGYHEETTVGAAIDLMLSLRELHEAAREYYLSGKCLYGAKKTSTRFQRQRHLNKLRKRHD